MLGEAFREGKTIRHGMDEKLEEKIDELIHEVKVTRKGILNHWRVVIGLMAISIIGSLAL